jgi:histone deacetylase 1/2
MVAKSGRNNQNRGGGRGNGGRGGFTRGSKGDRGRGRPQGSNFLTDVYCQLCGKEGHTVVWCFKRFDATFTGPPQKSASTATSSSYGVDTNWYMDSGATDHITNELEKLSFRDKYHDNDQIHAANGQGMEISHVGHSTLQSPSSLPYSS